MTLAGQWASCTQDKRCCTKYYSRVAFAAHIPVQVPLCIQEAAEWHAERCLHLIRVWLRHKARGHLQGRHKSVRGHERCMLDQIHTHSLRMNACYSCLRPTLCIFLLQCVNNKAPSSSADRQLLLAAHHLAGQWQLDRPHSSPGPLPEQPQGSLTGGACSTWVPAGRSPAGHEGQAADSRAESAPGCVWGGGGCLTI
jgi:hypothetical protein